MGNKIFTEDIVVTLPHPPIQKRMILFLCTVIQRAWELLLEDASNGVQLNSQYENRITTELVRILENKLRHRGIIEGFNKKTFGMVHRDTKKVNFDNNHPDKMPDIFFDLQRDEQSIISDQDGLFVECKPVDNKHSILSCYCKDGLIRFVKGDYAWAMQNAMMIGYVKDNKTLEDLTAVLNNEECSVCNTNSHIKINEAIYESLHKRKFNWPANGEEACKMSVTHLWLQHQLPVTTES